ncbi:hypothetical protein AK830_g12063 [Neonectria ditissima]|uniref:Uncharacterized protein n=1 Tax=Neonectria ditissima TaxID=78410 RepID=A0A0P7B182_9HYPO|nr:hypothetical protein AK830_g12063 [Neonectria ditissima]
MASLNSPGQASSQAVGNQDESVPRQVRGVERQNPYDSDEARAFLSAPLPPTVVEFKRQSWNVDEDEASELDHAGLRDPELENIPLYDSEDELASDDDWVSDLSPPEEGLGRAAPWRTRRQRDLPSASNGSREGPSRPRKKGCRFDDQGMVVVKSSSADDDSSDSESESEVDTVSTFVIPVGPRVQVTYTEEQLHPRAARAKALVRSIPGMRRLEDAVTRQASALQTRASAAVQAHAPALQAQASALWTEAASAVQTGAAAAVRTTRTSLAAHVGTAARVGGELGGQARDYLAREAWPASVDMALRFREEGLPALMRPLHEGLVDLVGGFVRGLPPGAGVLGGRRRRRRMLLATLANAAGATGNLKTSTWRHMAIGFGREHIENCTSLEHWNL